jgi:predicted AAA+ superfamily ATPase
MLVGPRATGKTTLGVRLTASAARLDRPGEAAQFEADPDAALRSYPEPVLLDEWHLVPSVLGAVKRSVDADPHPGRFVLTGSVRADLDAATWPGTGRVIRLTIAPLTVAERLRVPGRPFLDRVLAGESLAVEGDGLELPDYIALAMQSGFPEAFLARSESTRARWLESYVDQLLTCDAEALEHGRDPVRLRRYFEAYALNTAGVVDDKTLYDAAGITRNTALAYERLLQNLLVVEALPAWTSNRLKRLTLAPKRHLIDAGLLRGALGLDVTAVLREGDLFDRVLETFVVSQLRAESPFTACRSRFYHLRTEQGRREVDLVAEVGAGRVIGIEIKATSAPNQASAAHLAWLRDELGDRFEAGIVLHTGQRSFRLGERLVAVPIRALWTAS